MRNTTINNDMTQLTSNNRKWLFVPVPDDAFGIRITPPNGRSLKYFSIGYSVSAWGSCGKAFIYKEFGGKKYYPKQMALHATTSDITEEKAGEIVERSIYSRRLYLNYQFGGVNDNAIDSLKSLLKHHQITGRHAIIEIL